MYYTFNCRIKDLIIVITSDYIMISSIPLDELTDDDYCGISGRYTGYDRADGINYYKNYADKEIVCAIEQIIKRHNLYVWCEGMDYMVIPVDDDSSDSPLERFIG